jgi:hypothetical protein
MDPGAWPLLALLAGLVAIAGLLGLTWDALRRRRRSATLLGTRQTEQRARDRLNYWVHVGDSSNQ